MTDLYGILGLTPRATANEIKSAYRRLARKYHPDVSASPDSAARFVHINRAYQVLSDPHRRAAYDSGQYHDAQRTFYASRQAEVVAMQRHFDRIVDEWLARERQETAARSHAVLIVVPLFLSAFYVMVSKPTLIEQSRLIGRVVILALALYGLVYLVKNLAVVLSRYTYHIPDHLTSVFREQEVPEDKPISRRAGLIFLVCGYLVSIGLGYVVSKFVPGSYGAAVSFSTVLGALVYPPIAVLIIGSIRRIGGLLDRF
ncbi:MAG TPA: DnaJ domain-containing protein [Blastocatellia bacterium]|jgi:curved DNA-binding protein CbpA|nr:DnaJ domain-containing protein [Blastocatellia bacterium]